MERFIRNNKSFLILLLFTPFLACQESPSNMTESQALPEAVEFNEDHRPQFHFSPPSMWMNDPNGMVFFEGEYHLFYQHYPDDNVWGPMHWGHAVSTDLVHWEHLPIGLYPDSLGYIFSGSAVVDHNNTSGFAPEGESPLIAIFTYHDMVSEKAGNIDYQSQAIAYSLDKGRTWTKYADNPVIPNPGLKDFRDPKVFWHDASGQWVMIFACGDWVQIYNSDNLKEWTLASEFGKDQGAHVGVWECPDLFELPVDGGDSKWVMLVSLGTGGPNGGSATQYFIGDFDGKTFTNDNPADTVLWLEYGRDNYAGVTWADIPEQDGRRIFIGWMSNWLYANKVPTEAWRSAMTVARTFELTQTPDGPRIVTLPVGEQQKLRGSAENIQAGVIDGKISLNDQFNISSPLVELKLELDPGDNPPGEVGIELSNGKGERMIIGYEPETKRFFSDRTHAGKVDFSEEFPGKRYAPDATGSNLLEMHLLIDVASVELFAQEGRVVMTEIFFPNEPFTQISLYTKDGQANLVSGKYWPLKSIW